MEGSEGKKKKKSRLLTPLGRVRNAGAKPKAKLDVHLASTMYACGSARSLSKETY